MVKNRNSTLEDSPKVKKPLPLEDPPSASSTDDEDMTDASSDNEDEPSDTKQQNPSAPVAAVKEASDSDSSSDDDEIEDSGKIQAPSAPIAVNDGSDSGESETDAESESGTDSGKAKLKRPSEEASGSVSVKRAKKDEKEIEPDTETKKPYFQRLWSEGDEIVILQGMINFKSETGKNPSEDMSGFYDSVKKSITYEAKNLNQFISKIHSLKKKFNAKLKKGDKLSFAKPHDENCFELSKLIWKADLESTGTKSVAAKSGGAKSKKKIKKVETIINVESLEPEGEVEVEVEGNWFEKSFLASSIVSLGMDEEFVKRKWSLVPMEMKKKIEEKWNVLEGKNLKVASDKIALVHEVVSMLP